MQRFAVIGLGRFGSRLARNLAAAGHEVIAIDRARPLIEQMRDDVTLAVALDATDEQALIDQGVKDVDAAIVSVGENFEMAALTTVTLKRIGVKRIVSRAVSPVQAQILSKIGADQIVSPEDESADRWTVRLSSPQFLAQHELSPGVSLVECNTPADWVGKTLADLHLRSKWGVHIVALKRKKDTDDQDSGEMSLHVPMPQEPLKDSDVLMMMGPDEKLAELTGPRE